MSHLWAARSSPVIRALPALVAVLAFETAHAGGFCDGAPFVQFDGLVQNRAEYVHKRVQTHGVLSTDLKHVTVIRQSEASKFGLAFEGDDESKKYAESHKLQVERAPRMAADLLEKLRQRGNAKDFGDLSQIGYYRQDHQLCGRVEMIDGELAFAVDDYIFERSYLLEKKRRSRPSR